MYASPSDNYWLVGDQPDNLRWSSARVIYVADSDATYVAWLAAGYEVSIIATEQELADLLNATYPAGSPIPILPVFPTAGGNGPIYLNIITATPTVMLLEADFTFSEKSPLELIPRSAEFREGLLEKDVEKEVPGGVTPFSSLSGNIVVPAGVYRLVLTAQAAGGGGGGIGTTAGPGAAGAGGAGETRKIILEVEPGMVIPYVIGAEGTGGVNANAGTTAADLTLGAGEVPFPAVKATASGISGTVTSYAAPLPAGIVAGDLLFLFTTTGAPSINIPAGWTQLYSSAAIGQDQCFWKIASGSEGATVTLTTGSATGIRVISHRIQGHDPAVAPALAVDANPGSPDHYPNPPNLVVPWGAKSTLWLAAAHHLGVNTAYGLPSGFTNLTAIQAVATAQLNLVSSAKNPSSFTIDGASPWYASTIGICPLIPVATLTCKGGTFGMFTNGNSAQTNGTTPTGSGGIRIDPVMQPHNMLSSGGCTSVGGATIYGSCPQRVNSAGSFGGSSGSGYGAGGAGAIHNSAASASGGAGAPGMIYIEGYGLDAGSQS